MSSSAQYGSGESPSAPSARRAPRAWTARSWAPHAAAAALYLALALHETYPLWLAPGSRIQGLGDPLLNAYIMDWVRHALFHQIGGFFQATFFWPHADSLAYGEHLLIPSLLALPAAPIFPSAVALHNLSIAQAYLFCALAAHALAWHWFRSAAPATVAGLAYGFAAYRASQSGHAQLIHGEFLPIMALAFEKCLEGRGRGWRWLLGASALGQWLCSWYWAVFSFWFLAPIFAARLWRARATARQAALVLAPLAIAAACAAPMAWPYIELKRAGAYYRPESASAGLAAIPSDFLSAPERNWIYGRLLAMGRERPEEGASERRLFPGLAALAGAALGAGLALGRRGGDRGGFPARTWLGATALMIVFAFGTRYRLGDSPDAAYLPLPLGLVERIFPFAGGMRAAARWMAPALLGVAMLSAHAVDRLCRAASPTRRRAIGAAACAWLGIESLVSPIPFVAVVPSAPPAYRWLAEQEPGSPVFELPLLPLDDNRHLLRATWHRQPTVNGTNGYLPAGLLRDWKQAAQFPAPAGLAKLRELRVRFVVIDAEIERGLSPSWSAGQIEALRNALAGQAEIRAFGNQFVVDLGAPAP